MSMSDQLWETTWAARTKQYLVKKRLGISDLPKPACNAKHRCPSPTDWLINTGASSQMNKETDIIDAN